MSAQTQVQKVIKIINYQVTKPMVIKQERIGEGKEFEVKRKTHSFWIDLSRRRQENQLIFQGKA
jgi:hypothetical protein